MKQRTIQHDQTSSQYADGLEQIWAGWEPSLRRTERILRGGPAAIGWEGDHAELLRGAQYRAHTAAEFASGLVPPIAMSDVHDYLLATLGACRDTLGVLAVRSDLEELDTQSSDVGLHAVGATREAFTAARRYNSTTAAFDASMAPVYVEPGFHNGRTGMLAWVFVAACAVVCTALVFELFLLMPSH